MSLFMDIKNFGTYQVILFILLYLWSTVNMPVRSIRLNPIKKNMLSRSTTDAAMIPIPIPSPTRHIVCTIGSLFIIELG